MKIFFCFNQISFAIAKEYQKKSKFIVIIIAAPERIKIHKSKNVFFYKRYIGKLVLFLSALTKQIEVIIPHDEGNKTHKKISIYAKNISLIDDGLDSFRKNPKNISQQLLRRVKKYYTLDHELPMAQWTKSLDLIKVCPMESLLDDIKPAAILDNFKTIIFESPGINFNDINPDETTVVFCHPNINKRMSGTLDIKKIDSQEYNAEKTLLNFKGDVFIGESMLLIFALQSKNVNLTKLHIHISEDQFRNLECLQRLFFESNVSIKIF